jgi:DNA polymerase IIIc chi subunit
LEPQWEQQPDRLRNNLVKVANKYPKMKPEEQERVRRRITRWASLTPEQRQAARERYKQLKKQPPEKQKEVKKKWESYQSQRGQPSTDAPLRDGSTGHPLPPAAPLK